MSKANAMPAFRLPLLALILLFHCTAFSQPFTVNTGFPPPVMNLLQEIMQLTFARANIDMDFSFQPAERSIALVAEGIDDAECCRIPAAIKKDYPDLVQVDEPVYSVKFSAFAKRPVPEITGFDSLKPYTVATVTGWKILVINIGKVEPEVFHILDNAESMFQILQLDRIDIATYGYLAGLHTLKTQGLHEISAIQPPLAEKSLYLFLHNKHKNLAPALARAIKELKQEGRIDEIISRFEPSE